jgi:hypothetical protein
MTLGRKLLPAGPPRGPRAQFAWLVRAIRATHPDPEIRATSSFRRRLGDASNPPLAVETINKLERGGLPFTVERCLQFERALGFSEGTLVDPYCYLHRVANHAPKGLLFSPKEANAGHLESMIKLGRQEVLTPMEWLRLSGLYRTRPELLQTVEETVSEAFFRDLVDCYERDERLMLEAGIHLRPLLAANLASAIELDPSHLFNVVETLAHTPDQTSIVVLDRISPLISDELIAPTLLESVARIHRTSLHLRLDRSTQATMLDYAVEAICSDRLFYCAQGN